MSPQIKALIDALHAPGCTDDMRATFAAHGSEFLGWG